MDDQNKNLILATALSFLVILVWFVLFPPEESLTPPATEISQTTDDTVTGADIAATPGAADAVSETPSVEMLEVADREEALAKTARVAIKTPRLTGSLSLIGGRIDDLSLNDYNVRLNDPSEKVTLLSPAGAPNAYYVLHGWAPAGGLEFSQVPGANTEWALEQGDVLTQTTPVILKWDNGAGLTFRRVISVDQNYMFSITQKVSNTGQTPARAAPYGIVARHGEPDIVGFYILHEGMVRSIDDTLEEKKYKKIRKFEFIAGENANADIAEVTNSGWIGFTDKYWMTTLIAETGQPFKAVTKFQPGQVIYQTDMRLPTMDIAPGQSVEITTNLFAGAKEWDAIRDYQKDLGISQFVDAIDWGWFFFLTKPIFQVLHWLNGLIGNMGWAIIGLTIVIKIVLFPLAYKSYVSMARMKELQPEMEKIKEKADGDRQKLQKEMMALYKEKKVNPASGCLPILLQIPIFFSLYKVIFVTIELRHAPFFGWIHDLSAPDPSSILNLFGVLPWGTPAETSFVAIFSIGIFPILMGVTMWMQQKLNPAPTDAMQAKLFAWMPWVFMFMLGRFAVGLVIYWVANNTITFAQQYTIMRSQGVKPDILGNITNGLRRGGGDDK